MTTERPDAMTTRAVDLRLTGMTCAACAARIEKVLNRAPGVTAEVNFATETARVTGGLAVTPEQGAELLRSRVATGEAR